MIDLKTKTALWVLPIHLYAFLIPVALIPTLNHHELFLQEIIFSQKILVYAMFILALGSLFEIIQNHKDHWFITADKASGNGFSLYDGLFTFFILFGQVMILISFIGQYKWIIVISLLSLSLGPILYYKRKLIFLPTSIIGFLNTIVAFLLFSEPVIFMQLVMVGLTIVFFNKLIATNNQYFHGLTTLCASSGIVFLVIAIKKAALIS